jgi:hypothetical protein
VRCPRGDASSLGAVPTVGLPASNLAFVLTFGIFVAAFVALCVITIAWTIRRDRRGRAEWLERRRQAEGDAEGHNGTRPTGGQ